MDGSGQQLVIASPGSRYQLHLVLQEGHAQGHQKQTHLHPACQPVYNCKAHRLLVATTSTSFFPAKQARRQAAQPKRGKTRCVSYQDTILQATQLSHLSRGPEAYQAIIGGCRQ